MKTFTLEIKTPEKRLVLDRAQKLVAQAIDGEIGILPDHTALATALAKAPLRYTLESGEEVKLDAGEGFLVVAKNHVSVLLEA